MARERKIQNAIMLSFIQPTHVLIKMIAVPPTMGEIQQKFVPIQPLLAKVQTEWGTQKISQINFLIPDR